MRVEQKITKESQQNTTTTIWWYPDNCLYDNWLCWPEGL